MSSTTTLRPAPPKSKKNQEQRPGFFRNIVDVTGGTILGVALLSSAVVAGATAGLAISFRNLPDVRGLKTFCASPNQLYLRCKGRELLSLHGEEHRKVVPLDDISPNLKRAVLAIEDSNFY